MTRCSPAAPGYASARAASFHSAPTLPPRRFHVGYPAPPRVRVPPSSPSSFALGPTVAVLCVAFSIVMPAACAAYAWAMTTIAGLL